MNYDVSSRLRLINTRMQRNSQFIVVFLAILALTYSTGSGSETQKLPPEKWDRKLKSIVQPTSTTTTTIAPSANNAVAKRPETEVDDTEDPCAKIKAAFANITEPDDTVGNFFKYVLLKIYLYFSSKNYQFFRFYTVCSLYNYELSKYKNEQ